MLPVDLYTDTGYEFTGYSTTCVVCWKLITECQLKRCSSCKLVFYCNKTHQQLHWPKHKQLCKAVQIMISQTNKTGLFDDYVEEGFSKWQKFRFSLIYMCEIIMKRKLNRDETCLFLNPFVCKLCHSHRPNHMITCSRCSVTSYCSEEHKVKDESQHALVCEKIKNFLDYNRKFLRSCTVTGNLSDVNKLPKDMEEFLIKQFVNSSSGLRKDFVHYFLSHDLSIPLSLIYIIEKGMICLNKNKFVIHILGSGHLESSAWWCWEYIFHYFKQLQTIELVFIGPECKELYQPPVLVCENCKNSRSFNFIVNSYLYHDYIKGSQVKVPNVVVAFNCGFSEFKETGHDTWSESIKTFCSFNDTVIAFTSRAEDEGRCDLEIVKKYLKKDTVNFLSECEENPFRSLLPYHNFMSEVDDIFYDNHFITILSM